VTLTDKHRTDLLLALGTTMLDDRERRSARISHTMLHVLHVTMVRIRCSVWLTGFPATSTAW